MNLIELKDGVKIIADNVLHFKEGLHAVEFRMNDGESVIGSPLSDDYEERFYRLIPAIAGYYTVYRYAIKDKSHVKKCPVIAWREYPGGIYPIPLGYSRDLEEHIGYILPGGEVIDCDCNSYESIEALLSESESDEAAIDKFVAEVV